MFPVDANKVYANGGKWYDDVTNVTVCQFATSIPRASIRDPNDNDRVSDSYVEDGSCIRLKTLLSDILFPKNMIKKVIETAGIRKHVKTRPHPEE